MSFDIVEFTGQIENVIRNSINSVSGHEWDEDFITLNLLRDIRKELSGTRLFGRDSRGGIDWEIYKLKGTFENKYGDIALVVNINYKDGTSINGAAFLEAKKRDWRKTTFGAMNIPQAKRILKNAPRSQYLLYDYEEITNFLNGSMYLEEISPYHHRRGMSVQFAPVTRAVCVPLNLAVATASKDTILYRHGVPLSQVLSNRYFQGLDLEFDDQAKNIATGFLTQFGLPKYVVKVDISANDRDVRDQNLGVNQQYYTRLD